MKLPSIETILFEHLVNKRNTEERAPSLLADKLHANASSAGACARLISFRVLGTEATEPLTGDALFNFSIGDHVHDIIQDALLAKIPDSKKEVNGVVDDYITARADIGYPTSDGEKVCCEIKSTADFGFKLATGAKLKSNGQWNKKDQIAEGPKRDHKLQVGVSAKALGCDYLWIIYARKTATKDEPILWEWRYKAGDFEDDIQAELKRLKEIVELAKQGLIAPREYEGAIIVDPKAKRYPCGYCSHQTTCLSLGSGVVPLTKAAE